jgi:Domain of unknown function (DUF6379)
MFDKYMICENGLRNWTAAGETGGFEFGARLPYYRGLGLSMVENIEVSVDGQPVPREQLRFKLRERAYTLAEMETAYGEVWEMGEVAQIQVLHPGGLSPGPHKIELAETLRISYMPFPITGRDAKTLTLPD